MHPTVRRGTIWWTIQILVIAFLVVALVVLAIWKPSSPAIIAAGIALVLGPLLIFMGTKQIKALRHGYRYTDEEA